MTPEEEFAIYEAVDKETPAQRQSLTLAKLKLAMLQVSQEPDRPASIWPVRYVGWSDIAPYLDDEPDV